MSYFAVKSVSFNGRISFDIIGNKMYDDGFTQVGFGEHNFILLVGLDQSVQSKTMNVNNNNLLFHAVWSVLLWKTP